LLSVFEKLNPEIFFDEVILTLGRNRGTPPTPPGSGQEVKDNKTDKDRLTRSILT